ncbi:MAG TPA: arginine deiminase family protein [Actinomycetota bacterium]|nr:arginine deiminase family protein [Actinomycetota bacterium]
MNDKPRYAIVRQPADSFIRAVSSHKERDKIDPVKARRQFENYRYVLEDLVGEIVELPKQELYPDSCFTQDMAVVVDGHALIARTGTPTRRGEEKSITKAITPLVESVTTIPPPGTLEGGDVLRLGRRLLVGQSWRTTASAIDFLAEWAKRLGYKVVPVPVPAGVLHLGTGVSVINEGLVMGLPQMLQHEAFDHVSTLPVHDDPLAACNVLTIDHHVIASGEYKTHDELEKEGCTVHRVDLIDFIRADAGPTCLALLID